jgi:hypothetical protein
MLPIENIQDNSFIAIAKFCHPLYVTDLSLTCGAHLCHWHVDLSDIQGMEQNYNDSKEIIPKHTYAKLC